jgi:UDP-N-acetylmuramoyl-L-alanyl-D-glutamate--2,6-diaminopimelate ligase
MRTLEQLLDDAGLATSPRVAGADASGVVVTDVVLDTREVRPGALFCCVAGQRVDGHDLAAEAAAAGAVAVLAERAVTVPGGVAVVSVPSVRAAMGPVASAHWGHPSRQLTVIGITGTNGKTTTTQLLRPVFEAAGSTVEVIGTLSGRPGDPPTTPDAPVLQARLAEARGRGVDVVAMEVSSHGLALHRVDGTRFAAAGFTNLTQDHLDVHGTMEAYFAAKARLFTAEFTDLAVVGTDDPYGRLLRDAATIRTVGYSLDEVTELGLSPAGSTWRWRGVSFSLPVAGRVNVRNALCAATIAVELGVDLDAVAAGLAAVPTIAGRFEPVDAGQPFAVVVDYAHTPDALASVLESSRELLAPGGRLLVVFGAGGDRDKGKRPKMGAAAGRLADLVVLTSDNPRSEEPARIIDEIRAGVPAGADVLVEPDRRAAIALAVGQARPGDLVLIAGKGHEATQTAGGAAVPFDDRAVAREAILQILAAAGESGQDLRQP